MAADGAPDIRLQAFEGPLDLLIHLIERNRVSLFDIPVSEITDQYLDHLAAMARLDMEIASEFLVMAATLLHLKSRLLLPDRNPGTSRDEEDPREELVLRLLRYRRCKALAQELRTRQAAWAGMRLREPSLPDRLGLPAAGLAEPLRIDTFYMACEAVSNRNRLRFQDLSGRITHLLQREKVSIRDKMREIWHRLRRDVRLFFHEIFPRSSSNRAERVAGFLAMLELLRTERIRVIQDRPFDVILIEADPSALSAGTAAGHGGGFPGTDEMEKEYR